MILCKNEIIKEIEDGNIIIKDKDYNILTPNNLHIGTNSIDLTLSDELLCYNLDETGAINPELNLGMYKKNKIITNMGRKAFRLEPNILYLGLTNEMTFTDKYVPMLEGRSSIGRLGIKIHITAGFGDIGFNGRWTLEIECTQPTYLYPDCRIGQIFFHQASSNEHLYVGKYQNAKTIEMSKLIKDLKSGY